MTELKYEIGLEKHQHLTGEISTQEQIILAGEYAKMEIALEKYLDIVRLHCNLSEFHHSKIELFASDDLGLYSYRHNPFNYSKFSSQAMFEIESASKHNRDYFNNNEGYYDYLNKNKDNFYITTNYNQGRYEENAQKLIHDRDLKESDYPRFFTKKQVILFFRNHVRYHWNIIIPYIRLTAEIKRLTDSDMSFNESNYARTRHHKFPDPAPDHYEHIKNIRLNGTTKTNLLNYTGEDIDILRINDCGDFFDILGDKLFEYPKTDNREYAKIYVYMRGHDEWQNDLRFTIECPHDMKQSLSSDSLFRMYRIEGNQDINDVAPLPENGPFTRNEILNYLHHIVTQEPAFAFRSHAKDVYVTQNYAPQTYELKVYKRNRQLPNSQKYIRIKNKQYVDRENAKYAAKMLWRDGAIGKYNQELLVDFCVKK